MPGKRRGHRYAADESHEDKLGVLKMDDTGHMSQPFNFLHLFFRFHIACIQCQGGLSLHNATYLLLTPRFRAVTLVYLASSGLNLVEVGLAVP